MEIKGTDKQVKYAKDLLNELVDERRISVLEGRGVETLSGRHLEKYNNMIAVRNGVNNVSGNAGSIISLILDYNAGGYDLSRLDLIEKINNL